MSLSVIICTYNPTSYFTLQVKSIISSFHCHSNYEISVFDDTDSMIENKDHFFGFSVYEGARKQSASINFLTSIQRVDADWLFLSDQDDIWEVDKVKEYLCVIEQLTDSIPQIIFSDASLIDERGVKFSSSFFKYQGITPNFLKSDEVLVRNCVQGATICLNRKMVELLRESLEGEDLSHVAMHDWWIAILAKYCGNWTFIDKPLLQYRQHSYNIVGAKKNSTYLLRILSILRNPKIYYSRILQLKKQYQLWCKVSKRLGKRSSFNERNTKTNSLISSLKLFVIKFL